MRKLITRLIAALHGHDGTCPRCNRPMCSDGDGFVHCDTGLWEC